jgi:hypothetical protein
MGFSSSLQTDLQVDLQAGEHGKSGAAVSNGIAFAMCPPTRPRYFTFK